MKILILPSLHSPSHWLDDSEHLWLTACPSTTKTSASRQCPDQHQDYPGQFLGKWALPSGSRLEHEVLGSPVSLCPALDPGEPREASVILLTSTPLVPCESFLSPGCKLRRNT